MDQTVDTKFTLPVGWKIADNSPVKNVPEYKSPLRMPRPLTVRFNQLSRHQVAKQSMVVTSATDDEELTITYVKDRQSGTKTNNHSSLTGANSHGQSQLVGNHGAADQAANNGQETATQRQRLPQTGDQRSKMGLIGLGLLAVTSLIGFRKKKDEE